eukprot:1666124-Pleurochrysis_carterae.AAC.1
MDAPNARNERCAAAVLCPALLTAGPVLASRVARRVPSLVSLRRVFRLGPHSQRSVPPCPSHTPLTLALSHLIPFSIFVPVSRRSSPMASPAVLSRRPSTPL